MATDMTVSKTILEQLGGNRFVAMTGASLFTGSDDSLMFSLPGKSGFVRQGINKVKITLMPSDTYKVEFGKIRKFEYKVIETCDDIYAENLRDCFTRVTGLETSLGRMGRK